MKYLPLLLLFIAGSVACSTLPSIIYTFQEREYHPCGEQQFKDLFPESKPEQAAGLFCFRYCAKYKFWRSHVGQNCVQWETDVQDLKVFDNFKKFRDAGFSLSITKEIK